MFTQITHKESKHDMVRTVEVILEEIKPVYRVNTTNIINGSPASTSSVTS